MPRSLWNGTISVGLINVPVEDLEAVAPRGTRTIDIEAFVDLADIDPLYFDHPYFLAPTGDSEGPRRAYQLLVEAMGRSDRVALGRPASPRGNGAGRSEDLADLSREELYERAQKAKVPGRSSMTKDELVKMLSSG